MIVFTYALLSLALFQILYDIKSTKRYAFWIGMIPLVIFAWINHSVFLNSPVSLILIFLISLYIFNVYKAKQHNYFYRLFGIFLPWVLIIGAEQSSLISIMVIVVCIESVTFLLGGNKTFKRKKIINTHANYIFILGFFAIINIVLSTNVEFENLSRNFLFLFVCFVLSGFGSFKQTDDLMFNMDGSNRRLYMFTKLVALPTFLLVSVKPIIQATLISDLTFLLCLYAALVIVLSLDLFTKRFDIKSFSLANFNMLSLSLLYLLVEVFGSFELVVTLVVNLGFYYLCQMHFLSNKINRFTTFLHIGVPFTPLFLVKIYYVKSLSQITEMIPLGIVVVGMLFPLFLTPLFNKGESVG